MSKSLLDWLSAESYAAILDEIKLDPSEPHGLKWKHRRSGRRKSIGRAFWIDGVSYQSAQIVLILNDQWPSSDDLVASRIDANLGWNDVSNLKWMARGASKHCASESKRINLVRRVLGNDGPDLGPSLRLAKVCRKNHLWNGWQLGLQRKSGDGWRCDECERLRLRGRDPEKQKQWYEANKEEQRRKARERMAERWSDPLLAEIMKAQRNTPDAKRKRKERKARKTNELRTRGLTTRGTAPVPKDPDWLRAIRNAGRLPSVAQLVMQEQRRYWREHPESKHEHRNQWNRDSWWLRYQIDPYLRLYNRQKSKRRKAAIRNSLSVQLSGAQISNRFAQFDCVCAYCGAAGDLHIEHVVPISKGGTHSIGNIVPSCPRCNYSKHAHEVESWYRAQPFYSDLRWRKICRVLGWSRSSVGQLALL